MFTRRLLLALVALVPVSCKVVATDDVDDPPRVELKYRVEGTDDWVDIKKFGKTISVHKKGTLHLLACATSPAGPGLVYLEGTGGVRCNQKGGPVNSPYAFYSETRAKAQVGELTPETLFVVATIDMQDLCDLGGPAGSVLRFKAAGFLYNPTLAAETPELVVSVVK